MKTGLVWILLYISATVSLIVTVGAALLRVKGKYILVCNTVPQYPDSTHKGFEANC